MKEKTFSTFAFLIFFLTYRILRKLVQIIIRLILVVNKNLKKITDRKRKRSWKYGKSHGRLDHSTHARMLFTRSIEFSRVRKTNGVPSGRILLVKKRYFSVDRFTGYKKSSQNQLGRVLPFAFALTCFKIYLNMHHCNVLCGVL